MTSEITTPKVGIFWYVPDNGKQSLVADQLSVADAEAYGDCLTYPRGHYEIWEEWQKLGASQLVRRGLPAAIAGHEYEEFPRGRVVYHRGQKHFIIYADRRLIEPNITAYIAEKFGLEKEPWSVKPDDHYRT